MSSQDDLWARIYIWIANIIGLIYNIPQIIHTYKTKKVNDISTLSLILRLLSSFMWCYDCLYFQLYEIGLSWFITLISSILISYYKFYYIEDNINVI